MKVYRIALAKYCVASGEGAKRYGGRWNKPGHPILYGGASIASSLLERLTIDPELFSSERYVLYSVLELNIPDNLVFIPKISELPAAWELILLYLQHKFTEPNYLKAACLVLVFLLLLIKPH